MKGDEVARVAARVRQVPALRAVGASLAAVGAGTVSLKMAFRTDFCNSLGALQGGFITALADAAGGLALLTVLPAGWKTPTIELKINFLEPIRSDITATARVLRCGSKVGSCYLEVCVGDGELAAAGIASYRLIAPRSGREAAGGESQDPAT